mmetsp:Transcript_7450/g.26215  ORF Transcript_7450/g.26215 Transcript_7450/m.26215 type:complete len:420 (-) Transcript_7450:1174-2433(-)
MARRRRRPRGAHPAPGRGGQLLGRGADGAVRAVLGAVLRLQARPPRGGRLPRGRRQVHRVLQPRVHGVAQVERREPHPAGEQEHRHRHGSGAHGPDPAGRGEQLRDGPGHAHHGARGGARRDDVRSRERGGQDQAEGDRRPHASRRLPRQRRCPALQRRARLRRAQAPPPRRQVRAPAGHPWPGALHPEGRRGRRRPQRRLRPAGCQERRAGVQGDGGGGGPLRADARPRGGAAGAGAGQGTGQRRAPRRRRVPALRHLRLPRGPHAAHGGGAGHDGGHGGLQAGDGRGEEEVEGGGQGRREGRDQVRGGGDGGARGEGRRGDGPGAQVRVGHAPAVRRQGDTHRGRLRGRHRRRRGGRGAGPHAVLRGAGRADLRHRRPRGLVLQPRRGRVPGGGRLRAAHGRAQRADEGRRQGDGEG